MLLYMNYFWPRGKQIKITLTYVKRDEMIVD